MKKIKVIFVFTLLLINFKTFSAERIVNNDNLELYNEEFEGIDSGVINGGAINNGSGILSVFNSLFSLNTSGNEGGGIYNQGTINILDKNTLFKSNTAKDGAALANFNGGQISTISSSFISNVASASGGAIANQSKKNAPVKIQTIQDVLFVSNVASASGGAIFNKANSADAIIDLIEGSTFNSNYSNQGGAIANSTAKAVINLISNSKFLHNYVSNDNTNAYGGAISNTNSAYINGINNTVFDGNYAKTLQAGARGGAIYITNTELTLTNSSFYNNYAQNNQSSNAAMGGAIYTQSSLTINADNGISEFSGNYVSSDNGTTKDNNAIHIDQSGKKLTLSTSNSGKIIFNDGIKGASKGYDILITGDDTGEVQLNNYVKNANFNLGNAYLKIAKESDIQNAKQFTFDGGTLDLQNGNIGQLSVDQLTLKNNKASKILLDVDLANTSMDTISFNTFFQADNPALEISNLNLLSDAKQGFIEIPFTEDADFTSLITYTGNKNLAYSKLFTYDVDFKNGVFSFKKLNYNPHLYAPLIIKKSVRPLTSLVNDVVYYELVNNTNVMGQAAGDVNLHKNLWVKSIGFDDDVKYSSVQVVDSKLLSLIAGVNSDKIDLKFCNLVLGVYTGYLVGKQSYETTRGYEQGGYFGFSSLFNKGNFNINATFLWGFMNNKTKNDFTTDKYKSYWTNSGIKTSYAYNLSNNVIIEPNFYFGYTSVNPKDYLSENGLMVTNDTVNLFEYSPGLKITQFYSDSWSSFFNIKYAFLSETGGKIQIENLTLPNISTKNYVEYGLGFNKDFDSDCSLNFLVNRRDIGRKGWNGSIEFKFNF